MMTTAATLTDLSKPGKHAISWCDETWNWLVGCSRISAECDRCYAEQAAKSPRLQQFPQYQGIEQWDGTVNFVESQLSKPLGWKKPRRIFTCSMSDVFHPNVPDEWVRSLRDQCQSHQIPFFYKQNFKKGKKISLPELDGQVWAEFPSPILGGAA